MDSPLDSVGTMQEGRGELEGDSFFLHEGLESCGAFSLENESQALVGELGVEGGVGSDKIMFAAGLQWF